ncbi:fumarylacetoacetate hydrolase family protein [Phycisphaeraceae bacterium D3-23]
MKRLVFLLLGLSFLVGCSGRDSAFVKTVLAGERTHSFVEMPTVERPDLTLDDAYKEQSNYLRAQRRLGRSVVGYKVAYSSEASRLRAGIDGPVYGVLLDDMALPDGGSVISGGFRRFMIEAEIAVTIGKTIDEPIQTVDDLLPYIATLHPAVEMPDVLYGFDAEPGAADMVAANTAAYRYALGPGLAPVGFDPSALEVALFAGRSRYATGPASDCMGGPLHVVLWLVQRLQEDGQTLEQGQVVLTGTPTRSIMQASPDAQIAQRYTADCGALGKVTVVVR